MQRREFWRAQIRLGHIATDRLAAPYPNLKLRETAAHPPVPHAPPPPPAQSPPTRRSRSSRRDLQPPRTLTQGDQLAQHDRRLRAHVRPPGRRGTGEGLRRRPALLVRAAAHARLLVLTISFFSTFFSVFAPAACRTSSARRSAAASASRAPTSPSPARAPSRSRSSGVSSPARSATSSARAARACCSSSPAARASSRSSSRRHRGLIVARLFIGIGLASFVTCQVWCSAIFAKSIVGR